MEKSKNTTEPEVIKIASELLGEEGLEKMRDQFSLVDLDLDGRITLEEGLEVLLERERKVITQRFHDYDLNGDGVLEFHEFLMCTVPGIRLLIKFQEYDEDSDGLLTIDEMVHVADDLVLPLGRPTLERLVDCSAEQHQGQLSYLEFFRAVSVYGFQ